MRPSLRFVAAALCLLMLDPSTPARAGEPSEPSEEFQAGIRRNVEKRRQRRAALAAQPPGLIQPWPMPASLIIRQTREGHRGVEDLLWLLRR